MAKKAARLSEVDARRAEAEARQARKKQCRDGDMFGFRPPVRPDPMDTDDDGLALCRPAPPAPTTVTALSGLTAMAATDLLMVCDFIRALGHAFGLPSECSSLERLAELVGLASDPADQNESPPDALATLHVQLLHTLLSDETADSWWAAGATSPEDAGPTGDILTSAQLSVAVAPRRLLPDAVSERSWPVVAVAVGVRLHEWLRLDDPYAPLSETMPGPEQLRDANDATPLQRAVWAVWRARPSKQPAVYQGLAAEEKLALLALLVHGTSQTAAARSAAEAQHALTLHGLEEVAEFGKKAKTSTYDHASIREAVRNEFSRLASTKRKNGRPSWAPPVEGPLAEARHLESVGYLAARYALNGQVTLLARDELDAAELDLLIDNELASTPVDTNGHRRLPNKIFLADAVKKALLHRRDELRVARTQAEVELVRVAQVSAMHFDGLSTP